MAGTALLAVSLSTTPGSRRFYALTAGVAGTWTLGGLASGPPVPDRQHARSRSSHPVLVPVSIGAGAFAVFYGAARIARHVPILNEAVTAVLRYAHRGSDPLVLATTLANGIGEEIFFRGALYTAVGDRHPVAATTGIYLLSTAATGNPSLVVASGAMGTLFALQRRATGGIAEPILAHLTWSTLMLRYLPPLFRDPARSKANVFTCCLVIPMNAGAEVIRNRYR